MGKKYIIELEERPFYSGDPRVVGTVIMAERLYRVKGFKSLVFDEEGLKRLTPYEEPHKQEQFDFSERLNEALGRFWNGSNDKFAKACDIPELFIIHYLRGTSVPTPRHLAIMAKTLGVSADYLLGLRDTP